ncbi:substrate-binding periplasmic protein [Mangrovitalea sediminis]|uniref:substrate-binding periplasmic protein n=1 Tax=Mangrovitalea sediminis TaxID=1982043 RepID=UPI000BE5ADF0|nr:transporter substrate-binding domain-containing protein [Mangrovitalea sediminis]
MPLGRIACLGLACTLALAAATATQADCVVRAGWEPWPPYTYRNTVGRLTGVDIELVRLFSQAAHCHIEFLQMPWKRQLNSLKAGTIDIMIGASMTAERQKIARFSIPYRKETMRLFVRRDELKRYDFRTFDTLLHQRFQLCATRGYFYGSAFQAILDNPKERQDVTLVTNSSQGFMMLQLHRVDGVLEDALVAHFLLQELAFRDAVVASPLPVNEDDIYLMFSRQNDSQQLVDRFNQAIQTVRDEGRYASILRPYTGKGDPQ